MIADDKNPQTYLDWYSKVNSVHSKVVRPTSKQLKVKVMYKSLLE